MRTILKRRLSAVLCLLLTVSIVLGAFPLSSMEVHAVEEEFKIDEKGELTEYNGSGGVVAIPENVTSIGSYAFENYKGLTNLDITIPSSVTRIGEYAFNGCSGLSNISIPEGVESIEYAAFSSCSGLTSITIPPSVMYIGEEVFNGCNDVTIYGKAGSYAEAYADEKGIKFSIDESFSQPAEKKALSDNNVTLSQTSYTYDGQPKKPSVTVKDGSIILTENKDYTITYQNKLF